MERKTRYQENYQPKPLKKKRGNLNLKEVMPNLNPNPKLEKKEPRRMPKKIGE